MRIPSSPSPFSVLRQRLAKADRLVDVLMRSVDIPPSAGARYRHWDSVKRAEPPEGLSLEEWWFAIKSSRLQGARVLPLTDSIGRPFTYNVTDDMLRMLRRVDLDAGGGLPLAGDVLSTERRDRYIRNSLEEEAITSSQLEGAATTRRVAKEMIRSGRPPRTEGERMILNNYQLMRRIREVAAQPLTPDLVLELQRIATEGTLDERFQGLRQPGRDDDDVAVYDNQTHQLLHRPPEASMLPERLGAMCAFANGEGAAEGTFLHPALRAITLHFWLAYDHPFVDGNGRTARALFYWSMLREGFWLAEFLSISRLIRQAPARYGRSFLYVETDANDLTYFLLSQLRFVERAIEEMNAYIERKQREAQETRALLTPGSGLNHRQVALVSHGLRRPGQTYTIKRHQASHSVTYPTARKDLLDLEALGLLSQRQLTRRGRALVFTAPDDLGDRLRNLEA